MASLLGVDRNTMVTATNQVQSAVDSITQQRTQLNNYHSELMSSWQSSAATAFTNAYLEFDSAFAKLIAALQNIQQTLGVTHSVYNDTESANSSVMSKISVING